MSSDVTLQDLAYFGTYWQFLQKTEDAPPIALSGGYQNAQVHNSTTDGLFFYGTVEKADAEGHITDVILSFAGANSVNPDYLSGQLQAYIGGIVGNAEGNEAAAVYEGLLNDPRYADATIHVTGHSLGAGYTQYIAGYALATHGPEATDDRAEFVAFAAPGWGPSVAQYFGLSLSDFDGHIKTYLIANDLVNSPSPVAAQVGEVNYLASYHPYDIPYVDSYAAHWPSAYVAAIGLPDWLTPTQQAAATAAIRAEAGDNPLFANDPDYGPPGTESVTAAGDTADNDLHGFAANDWLIGGAGRDTLTGGAGADKFVFTATGDSPAWSPDEITDFSHADGDKIDLRQINDDFGFGLLQNIQFIGSGAFTAPHQLRVWNDGQDTYVQGDFGVGLTPTFTVKLDGVHSLTASDFLLKNELIEENYTAGFTLF